MVIDILKETGAFLEGHFLLSSGKHSGHYVQCAKLLQYPNKSEEVLKVVCEKLKDIDFDVVVGPAMGGVIVSYELGRQLNKKAVFTERINGEMMLRRGFEIKPGDKVIISEDVVTTGKSSKETIEVIKSLGGEIVGIACIVDRSVDDIGYPLYSAIKLQIETYDGSDCPLCKQAVPFVKPGSRV